jgi:predicted transcriptional regulator
MKLSTRSRYGTRILVDLARNKDKGPIQIGEISKRQDISVKYLEQLIRPLKKAKLVCLKVNPIWLNVLVIPKNAPCPMIARFA